MSPVSVSVCPIGKIGCRSLRFNLSVKRMMYATDDDDKLTPGLYDCIIVDEARTGAIRWMLNCAKKTSSSATPTTICQSTARCWIFSMPQRLR